MEDRLALSHLVSVHSYPVRMVPSRHIPPLVPALALIKTIGLWSPYHEEGMLSSRIGLNIGLADKSVELITYHRLAAQHIYAVT